MMKEDIKYLVMPEKLEWEKITPFYGKVVMVPLEKGFGTTLGNSLRRVFFSSIPGVAITSVKIENVQQEFSTLPGIEEDVPQIISNLKQMIIKVYGEQKKEIILDAKNEGEVRAGDIEKDGDVEILNPHLHIATLQKGAHLKIRMGIRKGKGYLPANKIPLEDTPIGTIPLDAVFSPIKRVNFNTEDTRVGERTDYEKLTLEIWTNGSITPDQSLQYATEVLIHHYGFISKGLEKKEVVEKDEEKEKLLLRKITNFDLSVRSMHCMDVANIHTIGDLVQKTEKEMLQYKNFGEKSLQEIKALLTSMGLSFKK